LSTKVASILAEIGIDTSKFTAGINSFGGSINTAIGKLGGLGKGLNDVTQSLTGFNLAQLGIAGGVSMLIKEIASATEETQAYNLAMYDLAQKMGTSTEEASKLVQVGDDLRISQEQISTAMTYAIRNGVEPNIEGLADLADQYVALQDPGERGRLLLEKFGRSGMDMGRLMEKGGAGIREMSDAIEDNLIVTEKAANASLEWYEKQDKLQDQWTGIEREVGNKVIPTLSRLADIQLRLSENTKETDTGLRALIPVYGPLAGGYDLVRATIESFTAAEDSAAESTDALTRAAESQAAAMVINAQTNKDMISVTEKFMGIADLSAEEQEKATRRIVLGYLEQKLAIDGLSDRETEFLLQKGVEWGIYTENAILQMQSAMNEADNLANSIQEIPSEKTSDIHVNTYHMEYFGTADVSAGSHRAAGGPASGMTWVGEQGPELVNLPAGSYVHSNSESRNMVASGDSKALIEAFERAANANKIDYNKMARVFRDSLAGMG